MDILVIRLMGFGDVASILIPSIKLVGRQHPQANIDVLTHGVGGELMDLVPGVRDVLEVSKEQWPDTTGPAIQSFLKVAAFVATRNYDLIINLDTWFMPCFLARALKDMGYEVEGNFVNMPVESFIGRMNDRNLPNTYIQLPSNYLGSTYPKMSDWTIPWWDQYPGSGSYPNFYLQHCCGFDDSVEISLPIEADTSFQQQAKGKKIIALSVFGRKANRQYPHGDQLRDSLKESGYFVWGQFDGSVPLETTLGRLRTTDLLVTVPTSTQWLGKLVDCPSLVIPGSLSPTVLGAEHSVERVQECQYCFQSECGEKLDFACMDIPPDVVMEHILNILS